MTTTLTADLAYAHIRELRRQACRTRFAGLARSAHHGWLPLRLHRGH